MKITHLRLVSRNENEDSNLEYFFLARIKLGLFVTSHYACILRSADSSLTEAELKQNLHAVDANELLSAQLKDEVQDFFFGSNLYNTPLGELYMTAFERNQFMIYGKAKYWNNIECE